MRRHIAAKAAGLCLILGGCTAHWSQDDLAVPSVPPRPGFNLVVPFDMPDQPAKPAAEKLPAAKEEPDQTDDSTAKRPGDPTRLRLVSSNGQPELLPAPKTEKGDKGKGTSEKTAEADQGGDAPAGPLLTLSQAIQLCLQADPKLKSSIESTLQARGELVTAGTKPNPSLDSYLTTLPVIGAFAPTANIAAPFIGFDLSYPIDWYLFGKLAAAVNSAAIGVEVAEFDYADTVRQRIAEVVLAYYDIVEAKALVRLGRQDLATTRRVEQTLEKAVKAGGKAVVDLNRVRLDRFKGEQTLREAELALASARVKLGALIGRVGGPEFEVTGELQGELAGAEVAAEAAFDAAMKSRPDLLSARAQVARAKAEITVEDTKAHGEVRPHAQLQEQIPDHRIGAPFAQYIGFGVAMELPCHNRNQGNRIKARSKLAQEEHEYQSKVVELRAEIDRLVQEYNTARANVEVGGRNLRLATQIRDALATAYQAGGKPLLELLDAQRTYRETYRAYLTGRANYYRAAARLTSASGVRVQP